MAVVIMCILTKHHSHSVLAQFPQFHLPLSCFYRVFKTLWYALMFPSQSCHGDLFSIFFKLLLTSGFIFSLSLASLSLPFFYLSWFLSSVCWLPWFPSRSVVEVCKPAHAFSFHCAVNQPDISIDNLSSRKHQERILAWAIATNNGHV